MLYTYHYSMVNFEDPSGDSENPIMKAITTTKKNIHSCY